MEGRCDDHIQEAGGYPRIAALVAVVALTLVAAALGAAPAQAATSKAAYSWHIADQLLEDAAGSPPVAIAQASSLALSC